MKESKKTFEKLSKSLVILVLALMILSASGYVAARGVQQSVGSQADVLTGFQVYYKLDPRLSSGIHIGERWVSPPVYDIVIPDGTPYLVETRAEGSDLYGNPVSLQAEWTADDPEMLSIAYGEDNRAEITVKQAGETRLHVTAEGITQTLYIEAAMVECTALRLRMSKDAPQEPLSVENECNIHIPVLIR